MNFATTAKVICLKDLRIEWRTGELVVTTFLFSVLITVFCAVVFDVDTLRPEVAASGALWLSLCVSGMLAIAKSFSREREMGVWSGLLLSPASRSGIYVGKVISLCLCLMTVCVGLIPVVSLLFSVPVWTRLVPMGLMLLAGVVGFSAVGALMGAMTLRSSVRELLFGVVLMPLVAPMLILGALGTADILQARDVMVIHSYVRWLVVMDVIFVSTGIWLFDLLMED